ncbi:hypothetical protein ACIBCT_13030 [Streptosporangium sp. NPDC050855]|uniref:hypothetical protein n=1 Tax=Streptosporangium sp. NPDC050855 TaxID=3366194 RepID=UPI0037A0C8CE
MLVVLALAAIAVIAGVTAVAMGRGGELKEFPPDVPPLDLPAAGRLGAVDFMALQLPVSLVGYHTQSVDETLNRVAGALSERDTRIAVLEQRVSELLAGRLQARHEPDPALPASKRPGREAPYHDLPGTGGPVEVEELSSGPVAADPWRPDAPPFAREDPSRSVLDPEPASDPSPVPDPSFVPDPVPDLEPAPDPDPAPDPAPAPGLVPALEPVPDVAPDPEPVRDVAPDPEPVRDVAPDPEPVRDPDPTPVSGTAAASRVTPIPERATALQEPAVISQAPRSPEPVETHGPTAPRDPAGTGNPDDDRPEPRGPGGAR